ncbi:transducin family protein / WD-40 repeat family protein [Trypanosoma conorhini]|uniref:Transducin family protein / WD-40 repeat family protein n=1 Tax=Trypanosoma conorhini TaxID=83891 RepID=A0A422QCC5_9TRYP|nr:transducin family protein / WD-40 repeat family protein [Trypanosoma conorhini]RNF27546.1 transducin family protein / WD-40 repeat family protein [Trypanosoma conorhini]
MAPPAGLMAVEAPSGVLFRRLAVAPDYAAGRKREILATWSTCSVPLLATGAEADDGLPAVRLDRSLPWVKLPYPAIDVAWCPFKEGDSYASFLSACRSCPLQLWDADDASLRASYCCHNALGKPASPFSLLWSRRRTFLVGGYGGADDHVHVRLYDVLREGNTAQASYHSPCSKGIVSALADGPAPYEESLLLAGFVRSGNVDVIDTRHLGAAAVLRGLRSGVAQIQAHPASEYLVYAAGRLGDNRIVCWDLRKCNQILLFVERQLCTQQPTFFGFVRPRGAGERRGRLVSATHDGGVLVFDEDGAAAQPRRVQASLGPTAGLSVLDAEGAVAVTVGKRHYPVRDTYEANGGESRTSMRRRGKRERVPLDDSEPETEGGPCGGEAAAGVATLRV